MHFFLADGMSGFCDIVLYKWRSLPEISQISLQSFQKPASNLGHHIAWGAETCLRFWAELCTGCRNVPQIRGRLMHGVQKRTSDSGQNYAWGAETCPRFRAELCTGCINAPRIQGRLLHGVHNIPPDLEHINEIPKRSVWNCTYFFIVTEAFVLCFAQFR